MATGIRFAAVTVVAILVSHSVHSQTLTALTPDGTDAVGESVSPADDDQFRDDDLRDRMAAKAERFGAAPTEADKLARLAVLQQQQALYGPRFGNASSANGLPQWRSLGPTSAKYQTNGVTLKISDSGRVRTILQSPSDPDTVYVLTSGGGLWMTANFSHANPRWEPLTDGLLTTSGGSVAMGRSPKTLYLGLGDPFDGLPGLGGVMTRSLDSGKTWQPFVSLAGASFVTDVKVDSTGPVDIVLVATDVGIFRSTDAGATFQYVFGTGQFFWSLVRSSAGWLASSADYQSFSAPGHIVRSADKGATWVSSEAGFTNAGRSTLAVGQPGDTVVFAYAGAIDGAAQKDLYRSNDGGVTWTALNITGKAPTNPNYFQSDMNLMGSQAFYNQMILVDGQDSSRGTVYLGGQLSTAKTTNGGAEWTLISTWLPYPELNVTLPYVHADCHAAAFLSVKGKRTVAFGTDGGVFISMDAGSSWDFSKNDGIVTFLSQTVISSPKNQQSVITGMQDTGTRARLGASSFFNQFNGGDGEGVGWSQANNSYTLASVPGAIYSFQGLLPNTRAQFVAGWSFPSAFFFTPVATPTALLDPTGQVFFTANQRGLLGTFNGGQSWLYYARVGSRLPANWAFRGQWNMIGLATGPEDGIALAGTQGRVAISTDYVNYGVKKILCPAVNCVPGFQGFITSPAWAPGRVLYVASESPIPGSVRVVRSSDLGTTWVKADSGLPDIPVYHLASDPRDAAGNTVYAATELGVYRTADAGASWTLFGAGLPAVRTTGLSITPDGKTLRAATYGRGLWEVSM